MNQAMVLTGFCEVVRTLEIKTEGAFSPGFFELFRRIERLTGTFNELLLAFRDESSCTGITDKEIMSLDREASIDTYLPEKCKTLFVALHDIAAEIDSISTSMAEFHYEGEPIGTRFDFVLQSVNRLYGLFDRPVVFLQEKIEKRQRG